MCRVSFLAAYVRCIGFSPKPFRCLAMVLSLWAPLSRPWNKGQVQKTCRVGQGIDRVLAWWACMDGGQGQGSLPLSLSLILGNWLDFYHEPHSSDTLINVPLRSAWRPASHTSVNGIEVLPRRALEPHSLISASQEAG